MLKRSKEENRFKLYLSNVGMLMSRYDTDVVLAHARHARRGVHDLAYKMRADAIITRDKEFPHPEGVPVKNCDEFFE